MRLKLKDIQGFTLVELVVVIAILGILILFLVLGIRITHEKSALKVCGGNKRTITQIAVYYKSTAAMVGAPIPASISADELADPNNAVKSALVGAAPRCPSGGGYTITYGADIEVRCPNAKHDV